MDITLAGIDHNDVINGTGVCISVFFQGCPHHCVGCFNPETWSINDGLHCRFKYLYDEVHDHLHDNGISRNLSFLGGEPFYRRNIAAMYHLMYILKLEDKLPLTHIWTGWTMEELREMADDNFFVAGVMDMADYIIDGKFYAMFKDGSLKWRGSKNQRIWKNTHIKREGWIIEEDACIDID